jgi:hypothetical protein
MNVATFTIESLIVHDVPRRRAHGDQGEELLLSEVPSRLDAGLRNFFTERMKRSLSRNHYEVERDPDSTSPVPDQVVELLGAAAADADSVLVRTSRAIAEHLYSTQTGSNSPGLLIVCRGRVDGAAAVAIMKLEREDAVRVSQVQQDGHPTFDVEYLRDLMLGKNTRVFKASLFALDGDALNGLVSDAQRSDMKIEVANFFLHRFLGCRLKTAPDVATKAFFTASQEFINTLDDPEKQARYEIALIAAMNTPGATMTAGSVVNQLDTNDRQPYRNFLGDREAPTGRFDKDTRLIAGQLRQMVFGFRESKLRLSGPPGDVERFVRFNEAADAAPVEIHDQVKDVRGGSR